MGQSRQPTGPELSVGQFHVLPPPPHLSLSFSLFSSHQFISLSLLLFCLNPVIHLIFLSTYLLCARVQGKRVKASAFKT